MKITNGMAAVVTGASSGLGAAVAERLAEQGAKVAILDVNAEQGEAMASRIGGIFCQANVTDPDSVSAALEKARAEHGQERICVNCAGIAPSAKTVSRGAAHDAALFQSAVNVNLIGTFNVASQSALGMSNADAVNDDGERGVIINTASIAAYEGQIGQIAYAASKAGVIGLTLPMARDLSRSGIRVLAIAPGIFGTPMLTALPQEVRDALAADIPFPQRLGKPSEFADMVGHMISNTMLNGEVIRLDGATRLKAK